jgi:hypothetical protein
MLLRYIAICDLSHRSNLIYLAYSYKGKFHLNDYIKNVKISYLLWGLRLDMILQTNI